MTAKQNPRFHTLSPAVHWHDRAANYTLISGLLDQIALEAEDFVLLPEMFDTGWTTDRTALQGSSTIAWLQETARTRRIWIQAGLAIETADGRFSNAAALVHPSGVVKAIYRKRFLFPGEREGEHGFLAGEELHIVDCGFARVCPLVCYDLRFPELWRIAVTEGAEVFTIGASWPMQRHEHWRQLLIARAIENQAFVVAANRTGADPSHRYAGGAAIIDPSGRRLAEGSESEVHATAVFDRAQLDRLRAEFSALRDLDRSLLGHCTIVRS